MKWHKKFLSLQVLLVGLGACKVRTTESTANEQNPDIDFIMDSPGSFNLPDKLDLKTINASFKKRDPVEIKIVEAPDKALMLGFFHYDIHYFAKRTDGYTPSAYRNSFPIRAYLNRNLEDQLRTSYFADGNSGYFGLFIEDKENNAFHYLGTKNLYEFGKTVHLHIKAKKEGKGYTIEITGS